VQRLRNGAAAEDLDFPPAGQMIEMFAATHCAVLLNSSALGGEHTIYRELGDDRQQEKAIEVHTQERARRTLRLEAYRGECEEPGAREL
jgi:hypothetical protein